MDSLGIKNNSDASAMTLMAWDLYYKKHKDEDTYLHIGDDEHAHYNQVNFEIFCNNNSEAIKSLFYSGRKFFGDL